MMSPRRYFAGRAVDAGTIRPSAASFLTYLSVICRPNARLAMDASAAVTSRSGAAATAAFTAASRLASGSSISPSQSSARHHAFAAPAIPYTLPPQSGHSPA